jgi:RNA polymerase sigma-70 factor (ECF subfamily)
MDATVREGALSDVSARERRDTTCEISLDKLVRDEYDRIRRLAWRFGLPEDEIDDAAQEIFARACAGLKRFRGDCSPSTWLTRIALNYLTSRRREIARRIRLFSGRPQVIENSRAGPIIRPETAEAHRRAMDCIRRLPVKLRTAFVLRYLEEMSCAEVADVLNIPEATVRTRIFYARRKLRAMLRGYEP